MPKVAVKIQNPPGGYRDETNMGRARQYVRAGRAEFIAPYLIRFLATPLQALIVRSAEERLHERITGVNYDGVDRSFHREARALPLIRVDKMLRHEKSSRNHSYSAAVLRNSAAEVNHGDPGRVGVGVGKIPQIAAPGDRGTVEKTSAWEYTEK